MKLSKIAAIIGLIIVGYYVGQYFPGKLPMLPIGE